MKLHCFRVLPNRLSNPVGGADELADTLRGLRCFCSDQTGRSLVRGGARTEILSLHIQLLLNGMETVMDTEKEREHPRHTISLDVLVDTEGLPLSALVTDISVNGLGVQSLKNIQPGSQASITAQIPDEVVLYGTLLWSRHILANNLDAYQMGFDVHAIRYKGILHDEISERDLAIEAILAKIETPERHDSV